MYKTLQQPGEFVLTMPGSYHSGFSMGLNIGEAVNFASKSWLSFGARAQTIYRKTREKIPVFPFEWLLISNIRHLAQSTFDQATLTELSKHYDAWLEIEKRNRLSVEKAVPTMKIMDNADLVQEDAHQCFYCTDFAFASMIWCAKCERHYCIYHGVICGCASSQVELVYRYST